jgi:uncharacterized protein YfaS (alpha-2-macroglobulin family)
MRLSPVQLSFRLLPLVALIVVACVAIPLLTGVQAQQAAATYTHGNLAVTIPYHGASKGSGRLVAELLDPEDNVLGRAERAADIGKGDGAWQVTIVPEKAIPFDEIIWQRLRYRFVYNDGKDAIRNNGAIEGIESISEILRRPVVHIIGQTEYLAGSAAAMRVIVADANNNDVAETGTVRIELLVPDQKARPLYSGELNRRGTLEAQFRFPAGLTGNFQMRTVAETPIGSAEFTQAVELRDKASILLTTEKPIYQPGQTIHARALALDRAGMKAEGGRTLTFEVEDSRGNKVFKKTTETDGFGIASAEFALADEVNLGTYHLRALMGEAEAPSNTAEVAINVERYVLPKFKVSVEFTAKDGKPRRDYRPGDHVTGTVRANYFFGKPVDQAGITVKASAMDVAVFQAASETGKTDGDGVYHFDLKLPSYFAGRPLSQGAARALVEATVTDSASHAETRGEPITVSESSMLITAVPEGGALVPHIENQVFLLTSYPDGTPAAATAVTVQIGNADDQKVTTDSSGVAVIRLNPGNGLDSIRVEADDHRGNRVATTVPLQTRAGDDQILLRTSRGVVKAGDRLQLKVLSTRTGGTGGTAYIDVVKNGQTILTRDLDLQNGEADLSLPVTPEMAGTLDIDAYLFGRNAQPVADHRLVFVQPADELKIETTTDAAMYKPGGDARINFHVTNARGQGVSAALGLQIVDEAVFALAEKQPGFAKVFFYLEQEAMKPRYEIHSLSLPGVVEPTGTVGEQDLAARALFSATEMASPAKLDTEFGRSLPQEKYAEYWQRYNAAFADQVRELAGQVTHEMEVHPSNVNLPKIFEDVTFADGTHGRDAWGTRLRIEPTGSSGGGRNTRYYRVRSAGPDRRFDTGDDLAVYVEDRSGSVVDRPGQTRGGFDVNIEHDRGPVGEFAEVTGKVFDMSGALVPGATVTLRQVATKSTRTTHSNRDGQFTLAALPAGRYQVEVASPGFERMSSDIAVQARDRAVLSVALTVGAATETVTVTAAAPVVMGRAAMGQGAGMARGMAGGVPMAAPMAMENAAATVINGEAFDALSDEAASLPMQGRSYAMLKKTEAKQADAPHVRSYFPEALYINPEIVTDGNGNASISIPVADSITTWRMAMLASTQAGAIGTGTSSLKVFQDFFVDLDLPVTLTQGDSVSIPVAVYNYAGKRGDVKLSLEPEAWYSLQNDAAKKSVEVESGAVGGSQFTLSANRIGKFKLTLLAQMGEGASVRRDVVVREIEVVPNGREQDLVYNGRLENTVEHKLKFPVASIPDATSVLVRLYPGPLSQVIEGMDSILRMPGGCFEQTSSSTYPNVLALDYMKRTKKLTPEVHAKAEGYIANGYQRLLTFEVPGGGFSWFGQAPANKILTAYGLMEFNDMAKVSEVDPRLIQRTGDWLARQQLPDGSWKPDTAFINEGATNRYNNNVLRITAYIAWSLANIGYQGPAVEKAKSYIEAQNGGQSGAADVYTLAIIANFAADFGKDREFTRRAMQALLDAKSEKDDMVSWNAEETGVHSTGSSAVVETTGLAAQALLKWGQANETVRKALNFISSKKQAEGNWGTTQATIMALRALLLASERGSADVRGNLEVMLNGKTVETLRLAPENNDLLHQFVFKGIDAQSANSVQLKFDGTGGLAYQVVGRYFTPWEDKPAAEALSIDVAYDRAKLAQDDIVTAKVTVRNNLAKTANMIMVDLGIPPGFDLLSEDLQTLQEKSVGGKAGGLEKFSLTATQAILYFNALAPNQKVTFTYRLRAKYPIRAKTFESKVYEYYDPDVQSVARPVQLEVGRR